MRITLGLLILFGLMFAEAYYQRRLHRMRIFLVSLETLRASLGELTIAYTSLHMATTQAAAAMSQLSPGGRRRSSG